MGLIYDLFNKEKVSNEQVNKCVKAIKSTWDEYIRVCKLKNCKLLGTLISHKQSTTLEIKFYFRYNGRLYCLCIDYNLFKGECNASINRVNDSLEVIKSNSNEMVILNIENLSKYFKGYAYNLIKVCNEVSILISGVVFNFVEDDSSASVNVYFVNKGLNNPSNKLFVINGNFKSQKYKILYNKVDYMSNIADYVTFSR